LKIFDTNSSNLHFKVSLHKTQASNKNTSSTQKRTRKHQNTEHINFQEIKTNGFSGLSPTYELQSNVDIASIKF